MKYFILFLFLVALSSHATWAASETQEFDSKNLTEVVVENTSGKVFISEDSGPKATVLITKKQFSDQCKVTTDRTSGKGGNKLILKVEQISNSPCEVDFDIKVSKAVNLDLMIGSGNFVIKGIQGALAFKIGSGDLVADGLFKTVTGRSGSGDVEIKGLAGGGELQTGSGDVNLTFADSGVGKTLAGKMDLRTGSGNAEILFPKGTKIKTRFFAGSGHFTNELGDDPGAKFHLSMKAGAGDLKVRSY